MRKKQWVVLLLLAAFIISTDALAAKTKILLIPLDDRPSSWQFPQRMAEIGNAEVVTPPRALWGHFFEPGKSEQIISWIRAQDLSTYDAAIVAIDMLAYGGLVASRAYREGSAVALKRIRVLEEMRAAAPKLKIYAQNVIMRLALTYGSENAAYYGKFSEWAKISASSDPESKRRMAGLEKEIPPLVIRNYLQARKRNLKSNLLAINLVKKGVIDFLILSQDDASPKGLHVADREKLIREINRFGLEDKITVQPGADEVSMLLLARALNELHGQQTTVKAIYCSEDKGNTVMPFEDLPLRETVSHHIAATGATEVTGEEQADVLFFIFASRDVAERAETFAREIERRLRQGKRVIVADVDPIGNVQGGDEAFTSSLIRRGIMPLLAGYASWNTAGNTIGTALPQGVIFTLADMKSAADPLIKQQVLRAQRWFTLHRVMDDYYFHNLIRKKANAFAKQEGASSTIMSEEMSRRVEQYAAGLMRTAFDKFTASYFGSGKAGQRGVQCHKDGDIRFKLPWNRTFEAEIDFDITCTPVGK